MGRAAVVRLCVAAISLPAWAQAPSSPEAEAGRMRTLQVQSRSAGFNVTGYAVEGNTLVSDEQAQAALAPFVGADKRMADVRAAADALHAVYERAGYAVVKVFPPAQESSDGRIVLRVVEGRVRSVTVKGNAAYGEANIRTSLPPLKEGEAPHVGRVVAAIAAANDNPAKQVAVNFAAGEAPGIIDAVVNVSEDRPQKFTLALDNAGSPSTGEYRVTLGYQNANLFDRDHIVTAQLGSSLEHPDKSSNVSAGYRLPLYSYGMSLDFVAAYSDTNTGQTLTPAGPMSFTGKGTMLAARANLPLQSIGELRHKLIYGLDYKDFSNACTGVASGSCGTVTSSPASLSYAVQYHRPEVQSGGGLTYAVNLPGGPNGSQADYAAARQSAVRRWQALRLNGYVAVPVAGDWQFRGNLAAQYTPDRLIAAEQFGLGGATSVRGYAERVVSGDNGYGANLEIHTPDLAPQLSLAGASLRLLAFVDAGRVQPVSPLPGESARSLASAGLGLRFALGRDLALRCDLGYSLDDLPATSGAGTIRDKGRSFGHIAIIYAF